MPEVSTYPEEVTPALADQLYLVKGVGGAGTSRRAQLSNLAKGLAAASATQQGVVTTGIQTFIGAKSFDVSSGSNFKVINASQPLLEVGTNSPFSDPGQPDILVSRYDINAVTSNVLWNATSNINAMVRYQMWSGPSDATGVSGYLAARSAGWTAIGNSLPRQVEFGAGHNANRIGIRGNSDPCPFFVNTDGDIKRFGISANNINRSLAVDIENFYDGANSFCQLAIWNGASAPFLAGFINVYSNTHTGGYAGTVQYSAQNCNFLDIRNYSNTPIRFIVNGTMEVGRFNPTNFALVDGINFLVGVTIGTKIGTDTSQKLSLWNANPIVQPTTAIAAAAFVANTSAIANDSATFDGYTIGQVVKALRNFGLLA